MEPKVAAGHFSAPWVESPFFEDDPRLAGGSEKLVALARDYRRDGFVVLRQAFTPQEVAGVRKALDPLFAGPDAPPRVQDAWRVVPEVRAFATKPEIIELLRFLYQRRPIPFQTLNFRLGTEQGGHSDAVHFNSLPPGYMCGVWVALEHVSERNGTLFYYPGSHLLPTLVPNELGMTARTFDYAAYEQLQEALLATRGHSVERLEAQPGDVVIWSANLVHGGSPILEPGSTRWSQVTHYFFEDCVYVTPFSSDVSTGEYFVRVNLRDVSTGKLVKQNHAGHPVIVTRLTNGRSRIKLDPSPLDKALWGVRTAVTGFPTFRERLARDLLARYRDRNVKRRLGR